VRPNSPYVGVALKDSGLAENFDAMIIAIERGGDYMLNPPADTTFRVGDVVWLVSPQDVQLNELNAKLLTDIINAQ